MKAGCQRRVSLQYVLIPETSLRGASIGCGLIGRERAGALDTAIGRDDVDFVMVATTHDMRAQVAAAAALRVIEHIYSGKPA
jgi:predicted dehydrogenase